MSTIPVLGYALFVSLCVCALLLMIILSRAPLTLRIVAFITAILAIVVVWVGVSGVRGTPRAISIDEFRSEYNCARINNAPDLLSGKWIHVIAQKYNFANGTYETKPLFIEVAWDRRLAARLEEIRDLARKKNHNGQIIFRPKTCPYLKKMRGDSNREEGIDIGREGEFGFLDLPMDNLPNKDRAAPTF